MNCKEIEILVPWGTISAKTWGSTSNPIVLMLHALEDNANTFNDLVFKLPHDYYYVSVDLPGHGKSGRLPSQGLPLQSMNYIYVIKLLADHFNREKYIIIGHSFGAVLGMHFGLVYPEKLDKIFMLDAIWFEMVDTSDFGAWTRNKFEELAKILQNTQRNPNPEFSYEKCFELVNAWRYKNCELTPKSTETLLQRSIRQSTPGKYIFTKDPKLKNYMWHPIDERYTCEVLKSHNISYKVVVIVTEFNDTFYNSYCPALVETYKGIGDWIIVDGNHHVHLNDPMIVANVINNYFEESVPI